MTTRDNRPDFEKDNGFLDVLFADERQARVDAPEVSAELLARVLGDAETVQAEFAAPLPERSTAPVQRGFLAQIGAALGGWPAFAGLAAASVCGLWLGVSPPEGLSDMAALYLGGEDTLLDPVSGFDLALVEG